MSILSCKSVNLALLVQPPKDVDEEMNQMSAIGSNDLVHCPQPCETGSPASWIFWGSQEAVAASVLNTVSSIISEVYGALCI